MNTAEFEDVVQQGYSILASLQKTVDQINTIVGEIENGKGSIGKLLVDETLYNRVLAVVDSVQQLATALNSDKGTIGKLIYDPELYNQVKGSLNRVDTMLQDLQAGKGSAGKLLNDPALYNETQKTIDDLHTLVNNLNAGKGTAGKLLTSDELHKQILVTVGKVGYLDRQNELRPGHDRTTAGEPAALRQSERNNPRNDRSAKGIPRQPEEVPANQTRPVLKQLIVNADDFGFTRDVNAGIVECYRNGILTATTLMANGPAFDDAVRLSRENPGLDIGCHLVLVGAPGLPATVGQLIQAIALKRIRIYEELAQQVRAIVDAGLHPTHLDTHKHTHLLPPVLDAVAQLSEEFAIPWVRRPFDFPVQANGVGLAKKMVSRGFGIVRVRFERVLAEHHCRTTDHFAGFRITGRYDAAELARLIGQLPTARPNSCATRDIAEASCRRRPRD